MAIRSTFQPFLGFDSEECLSILKLIVARLTIAIERNRIKTRQSRGEIAQLLKRGKATYVYDTKVAYLINEENLLAACNLIKSYCQSIISNFSLIQTQSSCPFDLREPIASLIYAASKKISFPELTDLTKMFISKYDKEFQVSATLARPGSGVTQEIKELLSFDPPIHDMRVRLMKDICLQYNIEWQSEWTSMLAVNHQTLEHRNVKREREIIATQEPQTSFFAQAPLRTTPLHHSYEEEARDEMKGNAQCDPTLRYPTIWDEMKGNAQCDPTLRYGPYPQKQPPVVSSHGHFSILDFTEEVHTDQVDRFMENQDEMSDNGSDLFAATEDDDVSPSPNASNFLRNRSNRADPSNSNLSTEEANSDGEYCNADLLKTDIKGSRCSNRFPHPKHPADQNEEKYYSRNDCIEELLNDCQTKKSSEASHCWENTTSKHSQEVHEGIRSNPHADGDLPWKETLIRSAATSLESEFSDLLKSNEFASTAKAIAEEAARLAVLNYAKGYSGSDSFSERNKDANPVNIQDQSKAPKSISTGNDVNVMPKSTNKGRRHKNKDRTQILSEDQKVGCAPGSEDAFHHHILGREHYSTDNGSSKGKYNDDTSGSSNKQPNSSRITKQSKSHSQSDSYLDDVTEEHGLIQNEMMFRRERNQEPNTSPHNAGLKGKRSTAASATSGEETKSSVRQANTRNRESHEDSLLNEVTIGGKHYSKHMQPHIALENQDREHKGDGPGITTERQTRHSVKNSDSQNLTSGTQSTWHKHSERNDFSYFDEFKREDGLCQQKGMFPRERGQRSSTLPQNVDHEGCQGAHISSTSGREKRPMQAASTEIGDIYEDDMLKTVDELDKPYQTHIQPHQALNVDNGSDVKPEKPRRHSVRRRDSQNLASKTRITLQTHSEKNDADEFATLQDKEQRNEGSRRIQINRQKQPVMKENELKEESNLSVYDDDSELMSLYEPQTPIDDLLKRANSNRMSVNKKPNPHDFQEEDDDALLERSNLRPQPRNPTYYGRRDSWSGQKPSHQQKGPHQKTKSFHDEGNISERSPNHMRDPSAEYVSPFLRTIPCTKPNQYQQGEEEQHCDLPREEEIIYNSSNLHAYGRKAMPPEGETPIARPTSGLQMSQTPAEEAPPLGTPPETPLYRPSVATAPPTRPPPPIPAKKPSGTIASREPAMPSRGETSATTKPTIQSSVPKESLPQETPLGQPSVAATPPARPPPAIRVWKLPDAATPMKASSPSSKGHVKGPDLTFNRSSLPSKTGLPVPSQSPSKPEANAESWQRDTRTRQSGTPRPQALDPPASLPKREASSTEVSAEPRQRDARTRQTEPTSRETFHSLASLPRREASTTQATAEPRQRDTRTKQSEPASPQSFDPSASSPRREVSPTEANSEARQRDTRTRQSYATPEAFDPPASLSRREASSTQANAKPRQRDTHRRQSETTSPQAFDPSASLPRREASSTEAKTEPRQRDTRRGQSEPTIPQTFDPPASLPRREASSTQANAESRQRDTRTKQSEPAIPQAFDPSADSPRREALSSEAKAEPRRRDTRRAEPATSQAFDPPASSPARPAPEVIGRPAQGPCKFPHVDEIAANLEALRLQRMKK